jgi:hypothetical protein
MKKKSQSGKTAKAVPHPLAAPPFRLPPILLEGDEPSAPAAAPSPAEKHEPEPAAPVEHPAIEPAQLPETYGTRTLLLTAWEPHWLYAHWDIPPEEQLSYGAKAVGQRLVLRVYERVISGPPVAEIQVHPDSRQCPLYVPRAETQYVADLGCPLPGGLWESLATSEVVATPPDTVSPNTGVQFAAIEPVAAVPAGPPGQTSTTPHPTGHHPQVRLRPVPPPAAAWLGAAFEQAMADARFAREGGIASITSPGGQSSMVAAEGGAGGAAPNGFWLNLDAEIVLYGATEPDARVAIAGIPIRLRPDGSFSYRFALPDGHYDLVVTAVSTRNDQRQARLQFTRQTDPPS